jgi:hypothetical protein
MKYQYIHLVLGMILASGTIYTASAQDLKSMTLTLIGKDSLINAIVESDFIDKSFFSKDTFIQKLEYMLKNSLPTKTPKPTFTLGWDGYYFSGNQSYDSVFQNNNELYSSLSLSSNANIAGLPVQIFGQATFHNLQIDRQLSDFSISFDQTSFLRKLRDKHRPSINLNNFSGVGHGDDLSRYLNQEEKKAMINEIKHRLYKAVLDHPEYLKKKAALRERLDSTQQKIQEANLLDSLQKKYQLLNQLEQGYRDSWDYKCVDNDRFLSTGRSKLKALEQFNENWSDPKSWMKDSVLNEVGAAQKLLIYTRNLDIGQFSVRGSDFTLFQMPLQGIHAEHEGKNWFIEIAQGRQRFQQGFAPSYSRLLFNPNPNKTFSYIKAGVGDQERDYFYISMLRSTVSNRHLDSLTFLQGTNLVWELSGKIHLNQFVGLEVSGATADVNSAANEVNPNTNTALAQTAFKANLVFTSPKQGNRLGLGYFFTGPSFFSYGNPFLFNNWRGLNAESRLALFKRKLMLNGSLKYGRVIDEAAQGGKYYELQFFGQMTAKLTRNSTLSLSFLPNFFEQSNHETQSLKGAQSIYQMLYTQFSSLGKKGDQLITSLSLSNYRFNYQLLDTLDTEAGVYAFCQEAIMWSNGNTLTGSINFSKRLEWFEDWLSQVEFSKQFPNCSLKGGVQALQQFGYKDHQWGVSLGMNTMAKTKVNIGFNLIYRRSFKGSDPDQILGNFTTNYTF